MRFLVTGGAGFLGWRAAVLLRERGHDVIAIARPGGAGRRFSRDPAPRLVDAGGPQARELVDGCGAVLHFAGVPDPASSARDPARAVRENVGTTLNLLEACERHGAGLVYPSTVRAGAEPLPDVYAVTKRLGELACALHPAAATVVRLTSVFGPGQVAWEGATGAIAAFAAKALSGEPLVIPGDPNRTRDFLYVDDLVPALETVAADGPWNQTLLLASGVSTPLVEVAALVREAAHSASPIQTPGGSLPPGENESYGFDTAAGLRLPVRPLREAVELYVDWLRRYSAAEGRARA